MPDNPPIRRPNRRPPMWLAPMQGYYTGVTPAQLPPPAYVPSPNAPASFRDIYATRARTTPEAWKQRPTTISRPNWTATANNQYAPAWVRTDRRPERMTGR